MNIRIPPKLSPGDLIAITAPSSGVPEHLHPRLELAIQHLRNRGYQVVEGECLRQQLKNKSVNGVQATVIFENHGGSITQQL